MQLSARDDGARLSLGIALAINRSLGSNEKLGVSGPQNHRKNDLNPEALIRRLWNSVLWQLQTRMGE